MLTLEAFVGELQLKSWTLAVSLKLRETLSDSTTLLAEEPIGNAEDAFPLKQQLKESCGGGVREIIISRSK